VGRRCPRRLLRPRQRRDGAPAGAAALFAFILAGQSLASLAVDHFGWVGFAENPVTPGRLLGVVLVVAGVVVVRGL